MKTNLFLKINSSISIILLSISVVNAQYSFSHICGTGIQGYSGDNGLAINAQLTQPQSTCIDASGNIYIADATGNRIRKINASTGIITTIADTSGTSGFSGDNGPALAANINFPGGIYCAANGDIYFSDSYNNRIRKISASTGIITTIAGTNASGFSGDNGLAVNAQLNTPEGIFISHNGDLYITDEGNFRIRKIKLATGIITTVAGNGIYSHTGDNGPATSASLLIFTGKCFVDDLDNIYIPEGNGPSVRLVTASTGIITSVAGNSSLGGQYSGNGGPATAAGMSGVNAVYVDKAGNIFISDCNNHVIRKVTASTGIIDVIAGIHGIPFVYNGDTGSATTVHLGYIYDIMPDTAGNLLLTDFGFGVIRKLIPCVSNIVYQHGAQLTSAANNATYQWLDCNNNNAQIAGATNQNYIASSGGSYAVVVTKNGCIDTSACYTYSVSGINEIIRSDQINIYPNPNNGTFNIKCNETGNYKIYNDLGQTVEAFQLNAANNFMITIKNLSNGIYFINGFNQNQYKAQKIIVAK